MKKTFEFEIAQLQHVFEKLGEFFHAKAFFSFIFIGLSWIFDGSYEIIVTVFVLLAIDTLTGMSIAFRNTLLKRKGLYTGPDDKLFNSRGIYRGPFKLCVYACFIFVSRLVDKHIPLPFFSPAIDAFIVTTEAYSIFENFAKMGFVAPSTIIEKLKSFSNVKKGE